MLGLPETAGAAAVDAARAQWRAIALLPSAYSLPHRPPTHAPPSLGWPHLLSIYFLSPRPSRRSRKCSWTRSISSRARQEGRADTGAERRLPPRCAPAAARRSPCAHQAQLEEAVCCRRTDVPHRPPRQRRAADEGAATDAREAGGQLDGAQSGAAGACERAKS